MYLIVSIILFIIVKTCSIQNHCLTSRPITIREKLAGLTT